MKKKCVLCGGALRDGICTECGMDNRKSDDMYYERINRQECKTEDLSHVHNEKNAAQKYKPPVMNQTRKETQAGGERQEKQRSHETGKSGKKAHNSRTQRKSPWQEKRRSYAGRGKKSPGIKGGRDILSLLIIGGVLLVAIGRASSQSYEDDSSYQLETESDLEAEEYVPYDWTEISEGEIPEAGETWDMEMEAGFYQVGTDIPEGIYTLSGRKGSSYRVEDRLRGISVQEYFGDPAYGIETAEGVKLFDGSVVYIEGLHPVSFHTENAQTGQMKQKTANPLTESFQLSPDGNVLIAGEDFPAGVYDVYAEGQETIGMFCCELQYIRDQEDLSISNYIMMGAGTEEYPEYSTSYKNLVLTEGSAISADYVQFILRPSSEILTDDYYSYYENSY